MPDAARYRGRVASDFTATVLLLAFLALPFHFHALTPNAQLTQECSCSQGLRSHAVLTPPPADYAPVLLAASVESLAPQLLSRLAVRVGSIRAPPFFDSF